MKKLILILLFIIPLHGFGQDISGTAWKIYENEGDKKIIIFENDGTFTYLNVISTSNAGNVYGDENETWELNGFKIVVLFNDGYKIMSGTINVTGDYMSGTLINRKGLSSNWTGERIKF